MTSVKAAIPITADADEPIKTAEKSRVLTVASMLALFHTVLLALALGLPFAGSARLQELPLDAVASTSGHPHHSATIEKRETARLLLSSDRKNLGKSRFSGHGSPFLQDLAELGPRLAWHVERFAEVRAGQSANYSRVFQPRGPPSRIV